MRFLQLRTLATSLDCSVAGAVEALINLGISAGMIPDTLDGFSAERRGEQVAVIIDGHELPLLDIPAARALASLIGGFTTRTIPGSSVSQTLPDGSELSVRRAGRGFSIGSGSGRIVVTGPMAGDVVRQLRSAAK